jgi:plasmid stabilization system protein ParE
MAFRVEVSPTALADAELAYYGVREHLPDLADPWFDGLQDAVLSLAEMPGRCPLAPESEDLGEVIRQLLYS